MSLPAAPKDAQATELLRVGCLTEVRAELLRYATKLAGNADDANDYYQQALLDGHDAVMRNGFAGTRSQDYKFYLVAVIKSKHVAEQRRRAGLAPLPENHNETAEALPGPGPAHLAEQVAKEIEQHPDRMLLRLHADGHSSRQIEQLTGQANRTVAWRINRLVAELRATFGQAWSSLE